MGTLYHSLRDLMNASFNLQSILPPHWKYLFFLSEPHWKYDSEAFSKFTKKGQQGVNSPHLPKPSNQTRDIVLILEEPTEF